MDLLVSLAIVALLIAAGVPALRHYVAEQRMKAAVTRFHTDLALARNEAVQRAARVVVCPASADDCITDPLWHLGWKSFEDRNDDRDWQDGEPVFRTGAPAPHLDITGSTHRTRLRFFPNGTAPGSNATITLCDGRGAARARQVRLSASGRIRRLDPDEAAVADCGT